MATPRRRPRKRSRKSPTGPHTATAQTTLALLTEISEKRLDPTLLTKEQRQACVAVLANGNQTAAQLAHVLRVNEKTIRADIKAIKEDIGQDVREWSLDYVLGDLSLTADKCSAMAMEQADPGLAWKIKSEMVKHLQSLGVIGERKDQEGIRITVEQIGTEGFEKTKAALALSLSPVLSGEEEPEGDTLALPLDGKTDHEPIDVEVIHDPDV